MDDKLRREFAHSQATVVRRPTFEHHPSTTSLALTEPPEAQLPGPVPSYPSLISSLAYGYPAHGSTQPRQLVPPALHSHPSTSSSIGHPLASGRAPPSFGSTGKHLGQRLEEGLPTVYRPDDYAPAPLPSLYSPKSHVGSVGGGAEDKTWGEAGHWNPDPGYGTAVEPDKYSSGPSAWPPHLRRLDYASDPQASSDLPSEDPSPDFGLVRQNARSGRLGSVGRTLRSLIPSSVPTRLFLALVLLQAVLVLAMLALLSLHYYSLQADDFRFLQATSEQRRLPVWLGVFALAHAWLFGMAIDGIRARNIIQIFGLALFNVALLTYSIIQIDEIRGVFDSAPGAGLSTTTATGLRAIPVELLSALIPAAIGAGQVGYLALAWALWKEFGWEAYVALGADRRIKRAFEKYNVFQSLIKFDVFFFLGFSIQLVYLVLKKDWEFYLTIVALPCSLLLLALGWVSARRELQSGMYAFLFGLLVGGTYFVYKTIRIWSNDGALETIVKSLTVFSALSLALLVATSAMAIVVMRAFGQGLKEGLDRRRAVAKGEQAGRSVGLDGGRALPSSHPSDLRRMSIE